MSASTSALRRVALNVIGLAKELVGLQPDVIFATTPAEAAREPHDPNRVRYRFRSDRRLHFQPRASWG